MKVMIPYEVDTTRIRIERARYKLTQKELAEKAGMTREKISFIENEKCKKAKYEVLKQIASVLNLKVEELLKRKER